MRTSFALPLVLSLVSVFAQTSPPTVCQVTSPAPNIVRTNGDSELTGDVVLLCTGGDPTVSTFFNFTLFLNTPFPVKIMNTTTHETEALLLIDEPQPGVANASNGCAIPYTGQVLGTPGLAACGGGSGNVYQAFTEVSGGVTLSNIVQWLGVPFVPPGPSGTRTIRMT